MKNEYHSVYEQSLNLLVKVAYLYYLKALPQSDIAMKLGISVPTVSRLLKKAKKDGVVSFKMESRYLECLDFEERLKEIYGLRDVVIAPELSSSATAVKKHVAREGARYLQRIVTKDDILGIAWGRIVQYLTFYLNPSLKVDAPFLVLNSNIFASSADLDQEQLERRMSMSFSKNDENATNEAQFNAAQAKTSLKNFDQNSSMFRSFESCTISISGAGSFYPVMDSRSHVILTKEQIAELNALGACGDIMLRFIDQYGNECESSLKDENYGISLTTYKKIPTKIIVASGVFKAHAIRAFIRGKFVDVLVIDQDLARELLAIADEK